MKDIVCGAAATAASAALAKDAVYKEVVVVGKCDSANDWCWCLVCCLCVCWVVLFIDKRDGVC